MAFAGSLMKFKNDLSASIILSGGYNVELALSDAIIIIVCEGYRLDIYKRGKNPYYFYEKERIFLEKSMSGTEYIFNNLTESILKSKEFDIFAFDDILRSNEMLFGVAKSAIRNRSIISIEDINENRIITGSLNGISA